MQNLSRSYVHWRNDGKRWKKLRKGSPAQQITAATASQGEKDCTPIVEKGTCCRVNELRRTFTMAIKCAHTHQNRNSKQYEVLQIFQHIPSIMGTEDICCYLTTSAAPPRQTKHYKMPRDFRKDSSCGCRPKNFSKWVEILPTPPTASTCLR